MPRTKKAIYSEGPAQRDNQLINPAWRDSTIQINKQKKHTNKKTQKNKTHKQHQQNQQTMNITKNTTTTTTTTTKPTNHPKQ